MTKQTPPDLNLGRYFVWVAWIIAFAILIFTFQSLLDDQWNPNSSPDYYLDDQGNAKVVLEQNRAGHYVTRGTINGHSVIFLLDTGATNVSIPAHLAQQLGLQGFGTYPVQTANGTVRVARTKLNELSIGNIYLYDVDAHLNPGMRSDEILLGMSALKQVEFTQSGKQLTLTHR